MHINSIIDADCPGRPSNSQEQKLEKAAFCIVTVLFAVIALYLSSFHAFWSTDSAARFVMVQNFVEHGSLIKLNYPSRPLDPAGEINPYSYYLLHRAHDFVPQYEPLFPLLSTLPYRIFGFFGLTIIPLLSGIGTVYLIYLTTKLLDLKLAPYVPLAVGLGTPVIVYSVVFWDHSVMMLAVAAAGYFLLRGLLEDLVAWPFCAGLALGVGVFIHELLIAAFLATIFAAVPLIWKNSGRRMVGAFLAGFTPAAGMWLLVNRLVYGSFAGAHISANMTTGNSDHPFGAADILNWPAFRDRAQEELTGIMSTGIMMTGEHLDMMKSFLLFASLLALCALFSLFFGSRHWISLLLWMAAAIIAAYLVITVHWANGLFEATPLLIPALTISWFVRRQRKTGIDISARTMKQRIYLAWISRAAWVYILTIITNPMLPGIDWGSRYLLPVLPFLVVLSAAALEDHCQAPGKFWRSISSTGIVILVCLSVSCQILALTMIRNHIIYNRDINTRIAKISTQVIVYSSYGTGAEAAATRLSKTQFLVRPQYWQQYVQVIRVAHFTTFTFVGTQQDMTYLQTYAQQINQGSPAMLCTGRLSFSPSPSNPYCPPFVFDSFVLSPALAGENSRKGEAAHPVENTNHSRPLG